MEARITCIIEEKKLQCWALGHWWVHVKTEHGYYITHETYLCPVCGGKYLYHH
ncbi:hypothetical protein BCPG3_038 [Bacillus phage BCPG3]|nr:hypothetical protein BCPG3_038 [Bacillus phage BCPG3]QSJ04567.1 hypothetical protein BCP18_035 [Bacillus phage BCP18]